MAVDYELWTVSGRNPVEWTIPILVVHDRKRPPNSSFTLGMPLMEYHRAAFDERMKLVFHERTGEKWSMPREELERIATPTKGGDPRFYFSWSATREAEKIKYHPARRVERDDFLQFMFQRGVGESRDHTDILWYQFCKGALEWMVNKRRPLDMHFLNLHPTHYRANWMAVLAGRFPKLWRHVGNKTGPAREAFLVESGFLDELVCLDLLAYSSNDEYAYRRIDVELRPDWWKAARAAELELRHKRNIYGYAKSVMDGIKRNLPVALRLFGAYLAQIARPCAAVAAGDIQGEYRFLPYVPRGAVRPAPPVVADLPPVLSSKQPDFSPNREPGTLRSEDDEMPGVPPLRRAYENMRDCGPNLSGSADGPAPAGRVPVLPAAQELAADELLAMGSDGDNDRVADGTEQLPGGI